MYPWSRKTGLAAAIVLIVIVIAVSGAIITVLSIRGEGPPLSGWMESFSTDRRGKAVEGGFVDSSGVVRTMASLRGKTVVLNFWATWCGPCIRELPSVARLQQQFPADRLAVIALSQDRGGWPKIAPFIDKLGLKGLNVQHDKGGRLFGSAAIKAMPTTILIGPDGREIGRIAAPAEWDSPEAVALVRYYLGR